MTDHDHDHDHDSDSLAAALDRQIAHHADDAPDLLDRAAALIGLARYCADRLDQQIDDKPVWLVKELRATIAAIDDAAAEAAAEHRRRERVELVAHTCALDRQMDDELDALIERAKHDDSIDLDAELDATTDRYANGDVELRATA